MAEEVLIQQTLLGAIPSDTFIDQHLKQQGILTIF
ncbi:MAG: hypothetical protein RLZZ176_1373 [Cyanobacteriota bacterium]